jgi:hypothetical protein
MNLAERTEWYSSMTGLSKAQIGRYRRTPVKQWTTTADRKIGGTFRLIEKLALDPELTWDEWWKQVSPVLKDIHRWVAQAFDTVADFVDSLSKSITRVLKALKDLLIALGPYLPLITAIVGAKTLRLA